MVTRSTKNPLDDQIMTSNYLKSNFQIQTPSFVKFIVLDSWMREAIIADPNASTPVGEIYDSYCLWVASKPGLNTSVVDPANNFSRKMLKLLGSKGIPHNTVRVKGKRCISGIRIK